MTAHPPHPPSEMVAAIRYELRIMFLEAEPRGCAEQLIRTMFAHVDRAAMDAAAHLAMRKIFGDLLIGCPHVRQAGTFVIDAALAAALAAALPGDA